MMSEKIENLPTANKQIVRQMFDFLYSGMEDYKDGRIEVAYGSSKDNAPNAANNFVFGDMEQAVDFAIQKNSERRNVYIVGSMLDPDSAPFGRSKDADFYASNVVWCDIDKDVDIASLKEKYAHCPPAMVVVTGRHPAVRVHLWWKLDEIITDVSTMGELLTGLQQNLGGDPAVKNPTSLMRCGGLINWQTPKKLGEGRIIEFVEITTPSNARKTTIDELLAAYPAKDYAEIDGLYHPSVDHTDYQYKKTGLLSEVMVDGREQYMHKLLTACIANLAAAKGAWPTPEEVFDEAWPTYISKAGSKTGKSLEEEGRGKGAMRQKIASKLRAFTMGRIPGARTIEEVRSTRKPEPEQHKDTIEEIIDPETGEITQKVKSYVTATSIDEIDLDNIPPREFLYGTIIGRKYVTMIVAPPGAGKSIFTMQLAISAATGREWGEWKPSKKNLNVWVYNNEEGQDELFRRIRAVMMENKLNKTDFGGRFYIDSGETKPIIVATVKDNMVIHTPDYDGLLAEVKNRKIDILVVDPFAETHSVTENSNEQIKDVVRLYRDIAFKANCAVLLVHHTRKGASEMAGDADSARGGGAQIGVVRRMFTLSTMTKNEATAMGVPPEKRKWFARFDDAKTNITAPADVATWFKFKSVSIMNGVGMYPEGDKVGVLEHINPDKIAAEFADEMEDRTAEILALIVEMMDSKDENVSQVTDIIDYIRSFSKLRFSDRAMRDMVKEAVLKAPKAAPFIVEGVAHSFSIINGTGPKKNAISVRKNSENLEI